MAPNTLFDGALVVVLLPPNRLLVVVEAVFPAVAPNKLGPPEEVVVAGVMRLKSDILNEGLVCNCNSKKQGEEEDREGGVQR